MSDAVRDALDSGIGEIRGHKRPEWFTWLETIANISAIGCMVAGMFVLSGISGGLMLAVFASFACAMILSLSVRILGPELMGWENE